MPISAPSGIQLISSSKHTIFVFSKSPSINTSALSTEILSEIPNMSSLPLVFSNHVCYKLIGFFDPCSSIWLNKKYFNHSRKVQQFNYSCIMTMDKTLNKSKFVSDRVCQDNRSKGCNEKVKFHPEQSKGPWINMQCLFLSHYEVYSIPK